MSLDLEAIAERLADNGLGIVTGREKTIFIYDIPENVSSGILLRGPEEGVPIDHELPGYFSTSFQVIVRDSDYVDGETKALAVSTALNVSNTVVGVMHCRFIRPRHKPFIYPVSLGDILEFSTNFDVKFSLT